jgi:hypothetical protein
VIRRVTVGALLVIGIASCGTPVNPNSPRPAPTSPSPIAATAAPTAAGSAVAIDRSLLGVLPGDVDGLAITESPEGEASAATAPQLSSLATGFASGLIADPGGADWAFAVVIALRPGVMSDGAFRTWRDSFDEGACSQAGGVTGHAEAELGGRNVYITSCGGGVHTYHVWLAARQRLVSISAVGERRFGEQLMKGIRD